jgi:multidrug efflux pump
MRIWLNPQKITGRGLTPRDVIAAVRSQNLQVSAGAIGGPPYGTGVELRHERR